MHEQTAFSMDFLVAECVEDVGLGRCGNHVHWKRDDQAVNRPVVTLCPRQRATTHRREVDGAGILQTFER